MERTSASYIGYIIYYILLVDMPTQCTRIVCARINLDLFVGCARALRAIVDLFFILFYCIFRVRANVDCELYRGRLCVVWDIE